MIADKLKRVSPHARPLGGATAQLSPVLTRVLPAILTTCFAFYAGTSFPAVRLYSSSDPHQFSFRCGSALLHFLVPTPQKVDSPETYGSVRYERREAASRHLRALAVIPKRPVGAFSFSKKAAFLLR